MGQVRHLGDRAGRGAKGAGHATSAGCAGAPSPFVASTRGFERRLSTAATAEKQLNLVQAL